MASKYIPAGIKLVEWCHNYNTADNSATWGWGLNTAKQEDTSLRVVLKNKPLENKGIACGMQIKHY